MLAYPTRHQVSKIIRQHTYISRLESRTLSYIHQSLLVDTTDHSYFPKQSQQTQINKDFNPLKDKKKLKKQRRGNYWNTGYPTSLSQQL